MAHWLRFRRSLYASNSAPAVRHQAWGIECSCLSFGMHVMRTTLAAVIQLHTAAQRHSCTADQRHRSHAHVARRQPPGGVPIEVTLNSIVTVIRAQMHRLGLAGQTYMHIKGHTPTHF